MSAPRPPTAFERFVCRRKGLALLYLVFLGAYAAASGPRLLQHSPYNHYVYLADCWAHGRLALSGQPPNENDWGLVDVVRLHDGQVLKGRFSKRNMDHFVPLKGKSRTILPDTIAWRGTIRYVTFPPFPAVLMLPFVAVAGLAFNDVLFNVACAALAPVLLLLLLRRLAERGYTRRTVSEDLWLVVAFGVGSVFFYCSVLGQVWYTAHVVAAPLVIAFLYFALEARRPALAGLFLGLGLATRPPLGFLCLFFVLELWRRVAATTADDGQTTRLGWRQVLADGGRRRALLGGLVRFGLPAGAVLAAVALHNYLRFESFGVFGHEYLNIAWAERIERWGLFNYHFLSRNLAAALVLTPQILVKAPYVRYSAYGMSVLITSPFLVYALLPRERSPLRPALWWTVLAVALLPLLYQSTGYAQFGYRYSADVMSLLIVLIAVGNRPLSRVFKGLVVMAVAINLFGAVTFDRYPQFMYEDSFFPHGND